MKKFKVTVEGKEYQVEVEEVGGDNTTNINAPRQTQSQPQAVVKPVNPTPTVTQPASMSAASAKPAAAPVADGDFTVKAPMPGSVLDVKVSVGDLAAEGDVLIVLEAMKMENELTAPQAGTVKAVLVKKGETVNSGDPLIILS